MPNWNEVLVEIESCGRVDSLDYVRRKYLAQLSDITGRNTIAYYSGWLQKTGLLKASITDDDKNGLMTTIHGLDRSKGLDLILHTPGGDIAATESIVDYLRKMFTTDVRAIVPQIAMSAGTMIACSCKEIIMGKQSNLGPIDPQFNGIPAYGVIEEFQRAIEEIKKDPSAIPIWQVVVSKYHPTFIIECEKAIEWSKEIVTTWLKAGMFKDHPDAENIATRIVSELNNYNNNKTHARHIPFDECARIGLNIIPLETHRQEDNFQDIVLTVHHSFMHTFSRSNAIKIVENHLGRAMVQNA